VKRMASWLLFLLMGCGGATEASLPPGERVHLASIPGVWDYRVRWVSQAGCFPDPNGAGSICTLDSVVAVISGTIDLTTIDSTHWAEPGYYSTVHSHFNLIAKGYRYGSICNGQPMSCWLQHPATDSVGIVGDTILELQEAVAPGAQTVADLTLRQPHAALAFDFPTQYGWHFVGPSIPATFYDSIGKSSVKPVIGVHELKKR
jgi:hypothetical protein